MEDADALTDITWKWSPTIQHSVHLHTTDPRVLCLASCSPANNKSSRVCVQNANSTLKSTEFNKFSPTNEQQHLLFPDNLSKLAQKRQIILDFNKARDDCVATALHF